MSNILFTQKEYNDSENSCLLPLKCLVCGNTFNVSKTQLKSSLKRRGYYPKYCSIKCLGKSNITQKTVKCQICGKDFKKNVSQIKKTKNNFCSHSCSAQYSNKNRKKKHYCIICKKQLPFTSTPNRKYCSKECRNKSKLNNIDNLLFYKKGDLIKERGYFNARSSINKHANKTYKEYHGTKLSCKTCLYDKHVEIAHIKAVADFNDDSLISEINHINNLISLCPNHHWEYDNGLLELK